MKSFNFKCCSCMFNYRIFSILFLTVLSGWVISSCSGGDNDSIDEPDIPIESTNPSETGLTVGTAKYNGQNIDYYYLNLALNSGTISGQPEYYMGLKAQKSSDNEDIYTLSPNVKVWDNMSISGESYVYGWLSSGTTISVSPVTGYVGGAGSHKPSDSTTWYPNTTDEINKIYFNFKKDYGGGSTSDFVYGSTQDLSKSVELKSAMAKIVLHFTTTLQLNGNGWFSTYIYNYKDENVLPLAGWLDISTGEWTMDNETVLSQETSVFSASYLVIVTESLSSTKTFYIPPMEFSDNVLFANFTGYKNDLTFPASKWEAGKTYDYSVSNYKITAY